MNIKKQAIQIISKKTVVNNRWTSVVQEDFKTETGRDGSYLIVERQPALMVIPIIRKDHSVYTYLVKQYRYPIGKEVWQFPMGTLENNADPKEHAKKELEEETGLQANSIIFISNYYIDPGLSRQQCYVYIAEAIIEGGEQKLEETEEGMIVQRFSLEELEQLIADNKLIDGWIYPGIYFLKQFLKK